MLRKRIYCLLLPVLLVCVQGYSSDSNRFAWGKSNQGLSSSSQLKERWVYFLLQESMRGKLEKEFVALGIEYEIEPEEGWLPSRLYGSFTSESGAWVESLERARQGRLLDLSSEFATAKDTWSRWLEEQNGSDMHPDWQANCPFESSFSYADFLQQSAQILPTIRLADLVLAFNSQGRSKLESGQEGSFFAATEGFAYSPKKGWEPPAGASRGGEPKSEEAKLFFNLTLTDQDKATIRQLITTMAEKNVIQLLLDKRSMERKGDLIQPVHPLRFAGYVLTDPHLKRCMKTVSKSTFKWNGFLDGYEKRLKEENKAGTLNCYVPGLADLLEVDRNVIQRYINQENYGGLIKHFL